MSQITTGAQLSTFITGLNAEATVDPTLLDVLAENAKTVIEAERPWMVLRKTNSALSLSTSNAWTTPTSLATITDFSRFYGDFPVRLFDGDSRTEYFRQVAFDRQLEYRDVSNTFRHDVAGGNLYFNGLIPFSGTLYQNYIASSPALDLTTENPIWTPFPARFLPVIGYYAIGIYKGAVDYDGINKLMLPSNAAVLAALKTAMVQWDDALQQSEIEHNDPSDLYGGYHRDGAIDRD
jgi:hypothetical protein